MLRLISFALAAFCYLQSGFARADEAATQLVGSWRLTSWVIQVVGGEATEPFGPNPKGRAVFTSDGFSAFMIARPDRKPATNDSDSAALLKSLMVYTGKCLLGVKSVVLTVGRSLPVFPDKQTFLESVGMSQRCQ